MGGSCWSGVSAGLMTFVHRDLVQCRDGMLEGYFQAGKGAADGDGLVGA